MCSSDLDFPDLRDHDLYACGAPVMVEALARDAAAQCGFDPARLVADVFVTGEADGVSALAPTAERVPLVIEAHCGPNGASGPSGLMAATAQRGDTLLQGLRRAGHALPSVCGGKSACGTCAVHIAPAWRDRLPPPSRREARLLEYLGQQAGHRLACQILLEADLAGLQLTLPSLSPLNPGA